MIKSTFPYLNKTLTFNAKKHEYIYEGVKLESVTGFLKQFEEPFNPYTISERVSRNPNSEYYNMDPAEIRKLWTKTASRGTKKHNKIEDWLNFKTKTCDEAEFLTKLGITPESSWSEIPLVSSPLLLAGTADIITQDTDKTLIVWDIKTAKKVDDDKIKKFSLQVMIYCLMLKHMTDGKIKIKPGGIISIKPLSNISEGINHNFNPPSFIPIDESTFGKFKNIMRDRIDLIKESNLKEI